MQKCVEAAKVISRELSKDHSFYLEDLGLDKTFEGIYKLGVPSKDENRIICFIVFAYDPDSQKLDIRKDRTDNKLSILHGLGADTNSDLFKEIISNSHDGFNDVVLQYLEQLTNWRWQTIFSLLDYHSNMIRFATQKTEEEKTIDKMNKDGDVKTLTSDYSMDIIAKINLQKSDLFKRAIEARKQADELLEEIRKEFMPTDTVTQIDLGFTFTETAKKKIDIMSWREYVKGLNDKK